MNECSRYNKRWRKEYMDAKKKDITTMFTSTDVELIVHATESLDKVIDALNNTLV